MKSLLIILFISITFSFLVEFTYAIQIPPPPETFYAVFINDKTRECSIVKTEDKIFAYEYPTDFKLNQTFSEYQPPDYQPIGRFKKICTLPKGLLNCELAEDGNDDYCKSEYRRLVGSDTGYDECQLTHKRCAILGQDNVIISYLDYVTLKPSKTIIKSSAVKPLIFLFFTFLILPISNIFIRIKRIFSNNVRNLILALSILFWIIVLLGWYYLSSF